MQKRILSFLVVGCLLLFTRAAFPSTYTLSTVTDFQPADLQNAEITLSDDGEITQNCYLTPDSVTITGQDMPKALFKHAACSFLQTVVVAGGLDAGGGYSNSVYLSTIQNNNLTTWQNGPSLPQAICGHKMVKQGKYIYCFGGKSATGISDDIYRAQINFQNQTIGAWQAAEKMPVQLEKYALVTAGGRIYILGGTGSGPSNKVYVTDACPDGSLADWKELTSSLPQALFDHAAACVGNEIWVVGGNSGPGPVSDIIMAEINADGTIGSWQGKGSYLSTINHHSMISSSAGFIVIGGSGGTRTWGCYYSIREDKTLSQIDGLNIWAALEDHAALMVGSQEVILGGKNNGVPIAGVRVVPLSAYQSWKNSTAVPVIAKASCGVSGIFNYAYVTGGAIPTPDKRTNEIYKAQVLPSGGFSAWTFGGYLPVSVAVHSMSAYNNRMYLFGGVDASDKYLNTAWFSNIINSTDGKVTSWTPATVLPTDSSFSRGSTAYNGYVYFASHTNVYYAPINSDGSLGNWAQLPDLPQEINSQAILATNGVLYALLYSSPVRLEYAHIRTDGSISGWNEGLSLPPAVVNNHEADIFVNSPTSYITVISEGTVRGIVSGDGSIRSWETLDGGRNGSNMVRGIDLNHIINVFYDQAKPSQFFQLVKFRSDITTQAIDLGGMKFIQSISATRTFSSDSLQVKCRVFNKQWGAWHTSDASLFTIPVNESGRFIQIDFQVDSTNHWGNISAMQINYQDTPVVTQVSRVEVKAYNNQINPLRGEITTIKWIQPQAGKVTMNVYNLIGDKVITLVDNVNYSAGQYHQVTWNGRNQYGDVVGSGIYVVDVKAEGYEGWCKAAVVK